MLPLILYCISARLYQVHTRTGEEKVVSGPLGVHGQMFGVTLSFAECPRSKLKPIKRLLNCDLF